MKLSLTALTLLIALVLGACGGDDDDGQATASSSPSTTVSLDDGLLVDSTGAALYTSEQERSGKVVCVEGCLDIWMPLDAPGSGQPTAGDGVSGKIGTVKRPDGARQVTLDGRPLYTFAEDTDKGVATGDNEKDSFGGQSFTWHAEGDGSSTSSSSESDDSGGGDDGYGGY